MDLNMQRMQSLQITSLQMNNVLFYIVFARHCEFASFLIKEMINNIKEYYVKYTNTIQCLNSLQHLLSLQKLPHNHIVVLFFFFLSIDSKMRHWLLNTQQNQSDTDFRDKMLRKNIELVMGGKNNISSNIKNPFLGQNVVFTSLRPHTAVSILMSISNEDFFYPIIMEQDANSIETVFNKIKRLVLVS